MKRKLSVKGLFSALFVAAVLFSLGASAAGMAQGAGAAVLYVLGAVMPGSPVAGMLCGVQVEVWQNHIEGNLFKDNEFILRTTDASQYVLEGKIVHIPQAGATPNVVKNRTALPAAVTQRTDTDVTYQLDQYTSDPILIQMAEAIESSYDKRESILSEHEATLNQVIADNMIITFAPTLSARIIRTTGAATATTLAGTTGNRLKFGTRDLKAAQLAMNKQNIPMNGRVALMSADLFQQLTDDMTQTQYRDFSAAFDPKNGVLGRLFGFDIYMRSAVCSYTNGGGVGTPVVNPYGAAANADDNDVCLCWQETKVERAKGSIVFREHLNSPTYYGDVYSMEVRYGARKRRNLEEGLLAIVQTAA